MLRLYESQGVLENGFQPRRENFRALAEYDFTQPPLPWKLNYEAWQWKMTGADVAASLEAYLKTAREEVR